MTGIVARSFAVVALLGLMALHAQEPDKKPSLSPDGKVITVVAEGAGENVDEALKNAIRAAVQQAVGVEVDAKELVKNDEIISSKILTASNGFVAGFDRLSLTRKDGLIRLQIRARVERADLIERLRSFNVRVRVIDPARLIGNKDRQFSDERILEMSKEELLRNKTEIIHDLLVDLPKTLEAHCKTPDRFDYDQTTSTLKLQLMVGPDYTQYAKFLKRLQMRLDKLSLDKGLVGYVGKPADLGRPYAGARGFSSKETEKLMGPDLTSVPEGWCLWVMTQVFNNGAGTRWTGYVLDADARKVLRGLEGKLQVLVSLRDAEGVSIAEEIVDLNSQCYMANVFQRARKGNWGYPAVSPFSQLPANYKITESQTLNAMVGPLAFWPAFSNGYYVMDLQHVLPRSHQVDVKLGRDNLLRLKDIRCAVQFKAAN